MSSTSHTLFDRLLENIKEDILSEIDKKNKKMKDEILAEVDKKNFKMKEEILAEVDKKDNSMIQDMINIVDKIHQDIVKEVIKENKSLEVAMIGHVQKEKNEIIEIVDKKVEEQMQLFATASNSAMEDYIGELQSSIQEMVQKKVGQVLGKKVTTDIEDKKEVQPAEPKIRKLFFRRDIFKDETPIQEDSVSLLAD